MGALRCVRAAKRIIIYRLRIASVYLKEMPNKVKIMLDKVSRVAVHSLCQYAIRADSSLNTEPT